MLASTATGRTMGRRETLLYLPRSMAIMRPVGATPVACVLAAVFLFVVMASSLWGADGGAW
jgi:hypothetical protein